MEYRMNFYIILTHPRINRAPDLDSGHMAARCERANKETEPRAISDVRWNVSRLQHDAIGVEGLGCFVRTEAVRKCRRHDTKKWRR